MYPSCPGEGPQQGCPSDGTHACGDRRQPPQPHVATSESTLLRWLPKGTLSFTGPPRLPRCAGQGRLRRAWSHCPRLAGACGSGHRATWAEAWHRKPDVILTHGSGGLGVVVTCHSHLHTCLDLKIIVTPFIPSSLPGASAWGMGLEGGGRTTQEHNTTLWASVEGKLLCMGLGAGWGQGKTRKPKGRRLVTRKEPSK